MTTTSSRVDHSASASAFTQQDARAHWHDQALWFVRVKRDRLAHSLPEWETLRERAGAIKAHTISHLADYLEKFELEATRRGAVVHWAADAAEHNEIVLRILQQHQVRKVAKSKSMLTEECHLNPFLERHGIEVIDTDLGEWIVQLRGEPPSHIVLPAIHIKKEEVGELFPVIAVKTDRIRVVVKAQYKQSDHFEQSVEQAYTLAITAAPSGRQYPGVQQQGRNCEKRLCPVK